MEQIISFLGEFILWGSVTWFWLVTLFFVIMLFNSERTENGWTALWMFIGFVGVMKIWSNFNVLEFFTLQNILIYLGIGFTYALIRTYFYGRKKSKDLVPEEEAISGSIDSRKNIINKLKDHVFRWWFLWPVSIVYWILSDLIGDIYDFIYDKVGKLFEKILDLGLNSKK